MTKYILRLALVAVIAVAFTACGDDDGGSDDGSGVETWAGSVRQDGDVEVGGWEGPSGQLAVTCSPDSAVIEAPGYTATIERPESDGPTTVTVEADDGQAITWNDRGAPGPHQDRENVDDAVTWVGDVITNDELPSVNGLEFTLNEVELSCAR